MKKLLLVFFLFFCFKFSAFTLKAPHFTSSWPLRCSPAAPPAGLCCCLSDHHCRERRLRRQRGPTSAEDLKPLAVCEAPTGSGRLTVSRTDGWQQAVDAPRVRGTRRWDTLVRCWHRCASPRSQLHVTDALLSITCSLQLGALNKLNGRSWCEASIDYFGVWCVERRSTRPLLLVSAWFILRHLRSVYSAGF